MTDRDEYPDPDVNLLLHARADRGRARGADAVYGDATDEVAQPTAGRRILALAAAVMAGLLIVAGIVLAFPERGDEDSPLVATPDEGLFAVCGLAPAPVGSLADDPNPLLCGLGPGDAPPLEGLTGPFLVGDIAGVIVPGGEPGSWVAELAPRPNLQGPVPDPPDDASGGALLRSQEPVRFVDGELRVERAFVVGHDDYRGPDQSAWYEIVLTTAGAPTWARADGRYAKDQFADHFTLGCRIEMSGNTICSLMNDSTQGDLDGGRIWQTSFVDDAGGVASTGGFERPDEGLGFTPCGSEGIAASCVDQVSVAFTDSTTRIGVNGSLYFEQLELPQLPAELVASDLYVYTAVMTSRSPDELLRFHGSNG